MARLQAVSQLEEAMSSLDSAWTDDVNKPLFRQSVFEPLREAAENCENACEGMEETLDQLGNELDQFASEMAGI